MESSTPVQISRAHVNEFVKLRRVQDKIHEVLMLLNYSFVQTCPAIRFAAGSIWTVFKKLLSHEMQHKQEEGYLLYRRGTLKTDRVPTIRLPRQSCPKVQPASLECKHSCLLLWPTQDVPPQSFQQRLQIKAVRTYG